MTVKNPPEGYHSVTPYLIVDNAAEAIAFYQRALGVMLSDEWPDMDVFGPKTRGGPTASLMVYVDDVDSAFERAIGAGGKVDRPVADQFWGDRMGTFIDPFGHKWTLGTHVEEVPPEEMQRRMEEFSKASA
jgi:PhnB protein